MINFLLALFSYSGMTATVYGLGEKMCGDTHSPKACDENATTASGESFDPRKATVAIALPENMIVRPTVIQIRLDNGPCKFVRVNDKKPIKWKDSIPWDLSPAAVQMLTNKPVPKHWSGKIFICFDTIIIGKK